uniref:F-box domain-containing protein n=1 Tax=Caenorhabditis japonica TaxID=281687 RepID=A0A8R1E2M1_CAEJA
MTSECAETETGWSSLPEEMQRLVVDNLGYEDRQSLAQCSKSDRALVRNCRWIFDRFDFLVNRNTKNSIEVSHRYSQDIFTQMDNGTYVERTCRSEVETIPRWKLFSIYFIDNSDFQEMASNRLNELFKAQNYHVHELNMDLLTVPPKFPTQISVNILQIDAELRPIQPSALFEMVSYIKPTVDWLRFRIQHEIPRGLGALQTVRKAKRLIFSIHSGFNGEDLMGVEGHFLDIGVSNITGNDARHFVLKRYDEGTECMFRLEMQPGFEPEFSEIATSFDEFEHVCGEDVPAEFPHCRMMHKLKKRGRDWTCYLIASSVSNFIDGGVFRDEN